jgi:HK97 family phage major capsid protein
MPKLPTLTPEASLADVRTAQVDAAKTLIELRSIAPDKRGETHDADLRQVADFIVHGDLIEKALSAGERAAQAQLEADEAARNKGKGGRGSRVTGQDDEFRSMGRQVTDDKSYEDWNASGRRGAHVIEVRNLVGDFSAGAFSSTGFPWLPVGSPQLNVGSIQRRRIYLRDIMNVQATGLKVVPYVREQNQVTNETGAAFTSEGSAKPEVTSTFENYSAIIEKIAAWIPVTDEIMSDAPTLRGYIDGRLAYILSIREEVGILSGTGASPQILGLDNVANIQTQTAVTGDFPATIGQAIGKVENADGSASGVVCNPLDYWVAATKRYSQQFDNGFTPGAPGAMGNITWGLPAVRTRGVASARAYVADWMMGATIFDREQTNIKVGDQHQDYFIRNLLVILAEKRIGVAWHRPNLFVQATVPNT